MRRLPKSIANRPFTYKEAFSLGINQYALRELLTSNSIERIERGLYQTTGVDPSDTEVFLRALKKVGSPSAVCLLSALSYYELTDIIPNQVWLMVPHEKRVRSNNIKLYRARVPKWKVGIVNENGCSITSVERTIIDALTHKTLIPTKIGSDALKRALEKKLVSLSDLVEISKVLGVFQRVQPYLETLS